MAACGRDHARKTFEIERILDRWEAIYNDSLNKNAGHRIR
jgi:hypothetical protein